MKLRPTEERSKSYVGFVVPFNLNCFFIRFNLRTLGDAGNDKNRNDLESITKP